MIPCPLALQTLNFLSILDWFLSRSAACPARILGFPSLWLMFLFLVPHLSWLCLISLHKNTHTFFFPHAAHSQITFSETTMMVSFLFAISSISSVICLFNFLQVFFDFSFPSFLYSYFVNTLLTSKIYFHLFHYLFPFSMHLALILWIK